MMAYDEAIYINDDGTHDDPLCEALIRTCRGMNRSWYHVSAETGFHTSAFYRMEAGTATLSTRVVSSAAYALGWDTFIEHLRATVLERPNLPPSLSMKKLRDATGRRRNDQEE